MAAIQTKSGSCYQYIKALQLGGTKTLPELFTAAGLKFDLSPAHIRELMLFVKEELDGL